MKAHLKWFYQHISAHKRAEWPWEPDGADVWKILHKTIKIVSLYSQINLEKQKQEMG